MQHSLATLFLRLSHDSPCLGVEVLNGDILQVRVLAQTYLRHLGGNVRKYMIEATAYDKNGRRLGGNCHSITAATQRDAESIAKSRQRSQVETVRVETRVIGIYENNKRIGP